jgi:RimJ/RimL family protein N-acetyltransferase
MELSFHRFQREHFEEYATWFSDSELNKELGPIVDEDWLSAILSQKSEEGETWAVFLGAEMIGVINATFDPEKKLPAGITEIAIKPNHRRQGLAKAILISLLSEHHQQGIGSHVAYIKQTNKASRQLFEGLGFKVTSEANRHGFVEYRYDEVV